MFSRSYGTRLALGVRNKWPKFVLSYLIYYLSNDAIALYSEEHLLTVIFISICTLLLEINKVASETYRSNDFVLTLIRVPNWATYF